MFRSLVRSVNAKLMPGVNLIASFLQLATAQRTRSTILKPLGWFFALCTAGFLSRNVRIGLLGSGEP